MICKISKANTLTLNIIILQAWCFQKHLFHNFPCQFRKTGHQTQLDSTYVLWSIFFLATILQEGFSKSNASYFMTLTSEADVAEMVPNVELSHQYTVAIPCCHVRDGSRGALWQNGVWHGNMKQRVKTDFPPCKKKIK